MSQRIKKRDILSTRLNDAKELVAKVGVVGEEDGGEADGFVLYGISGVISRPADPDPDGACCQALVATFGNDQRIIGTKDNRLNARYGELDPGGVALVTPGPARLIIKNEKKSVTAMTENDDGETLVFQLSGAQNNLTIMLPGSDGTTMIQAKSGEIKLAVDGGGSIVLNKDGVNVYGSRFNCNTGGGTLGYIAPNVPVPPTNGIAYGVAGPVNTMSVNWLVAP